MALSCHYLRLNIFPASLPLCIRFVNSTVFLVPTNRFVDLAQGFHTLIPEERHI